MSEDQELEGWRNEWQSLGGREGLAEELTKRVVADGQRIRRSMAIEIGAGAFGVALCIWLLARARGELVSVVVCAGILVFMGIWIDRLLVLRRGSLKAAGSGLDAFVELTRRRLSDDLRWSSFAHRAMQVLTLLLIPWSIWAFVARYPMYRAEPWRAVVGFGTAGLILAVVFSVNRRKRRKLEVARERFEALVAERTLT